MAEHGFGIVGCGMISEFHSAAVAELEGGGLAAVSDVIERSARKIAGKYGVPWHRDHKDLVKRDDVDIVSVCTPSGAHMEPAVAAAEAGKHVIVEKPIEVTLARADKIIEACDRNGVKLCAIFPSRFSDSVLTLKKAIDEGRFGTLTVGDCYNKWWRSQEYYDSGGWRGTWELDGGGACMNQAIHSVDLLQWLMGPVDSIMACTDTLCHERLEVEDTAVAILRFRNKALGVIEATTSVYPGLARRIEIHGDKGNVIMEDDDFVAWEFEEEHPEDEEIRAKFAPKGQDAVAAADPRDISYENHRRQMQNLIDTLEGKAEILIDGREGRKAVEIILGMYESAKQGKKVTLPL